jgi:hypothetical protein
MQTQCGSRKQTTLSVSFKARWAGGAFRVLGLTQHELGNTINRVQRRIVNFPSVRWICFANFHNETQMKLNETLNMKLKLVLNLLINEEFHINFQMKLK